MPRVRADAPTARPSSGVPTPTSRSGRGASGSPLAAVRVLRSDPTEKIAEVSWSSLVPVPQVYRARTSTIPLTEHRAITLAQLSFLANLVQRVLPQAELRDSHAKDALITWESVNLYHVNEHFVMPLTKRFGCSFVELVAQHPQPPQWFVSHWWGTPLHQTVELLDFHAEEREMPSEAPYWICTFANNQHDLSELAGELEGTPFVKAIMSPECKGTVALLDKKVTTFERIWCVLEHHVSTTWALEKKEAHLFDIAAWLSGDVAIFGGKPVPAKPTLRIDLCDGRRKEEVKDEDSGGAFPLMVSARGARIDVLKAKSSRPEDRRSILHLIAGTPADLQVDNEPPTSCDAYDKINSCAQSMFASGAMYRAAVQGDVEELERLLGDFPELKDDGISDGATPLYAASWKGNLEVLHMLLKAEADPNKCKDDGASPVFVTAQSGNSEALKVLLEARADPSRGREDGVTPLFMAVQKEHQEELQLLLSYDADANVCTAKGASPLHLAAQEGFVQAAKLLLVGRADPNLKNSAGATPLQSVSHRKYKTFKRLLKAKNSPAEEEGSDSGDSRASSRGRDPAGTQSTPFAASETPAYQQPQPQRAARAPATGARGASASTSSTRRSRVPAGGGMQPFADFGRARAAIEGMNYMDLVDGPGPMPVAAPAAPRRGGAKEKRRAR